MSGVDRLRDGKSSAKSFVLGRIRARGIMLLEHLGPIPLDQGPQEVGKVFPLYHLATGLQTSFGVGSGTGLSADNVAVLALWAVGGAVAAARNFRWEPQTARG